MKRSRIRNIISTAILLGCTALAFGQTLTFEGLKNNEPVGTFYNGGVAGLGSGPGPAVGVTFSANSLALIENTQPTGQGQFRNEPSPFTTLYFTTGTGAVMNVPGGFTTGFSFFYAGAVAGTITVYSGPNATGSVLATIPVPPNNAGILPCAAAPPAFYCNFTPIGVAFAGTAQSVDFGGTANFIGFDNITINSATPGGAVPLGPALPVPAIGHLGLLFLMLLGGIGGGFAVRARAAH